MTERRSELDPDLAARVDALPRAIEPERDLWKGVATRLASDRSRAQATRRSVVLAFGGVLAAAAVMALVLRAPHPTPTSNLTPTVTATANAPPTPTAPSPLVPEEPSFLTAVAALHAQLDPHLAKLPAPKLKAIRVSLDALDAAIASTRASLVEHPDDSDLREELDAEYEQEIQTLNDVLEWTTRT